MASFYTVSGVSLASQAVSPTEYKVYKAAYPTLVLGAVAANVTTASVNVSFILKNSSDATVSYVAKNVTVSTSSSLDVILLTALRVQQAELMLLFRSWRCAENE